MSTTDRDQALPMGLRERVMAASLLARGMGQPVPAVPEISADGRIWTIRIRQGIYFAEFDGPRERSATVTVIGD